MSKEFTPLDCFKYLCENGYIPLQRIQNEIGTLDCVNNIENALKDYELMKQTKIIVADKEISNDDLEKLKNTRMFVGNLEQCEIKPLFDEKTQMKLKALEIIKKKQVNVGIFRWANALNLYNDIVPDDQQLTQEEYDLLKKVWRLC